MEQIFQHLADRFSPEAIGSYLSRVLPELITAVVTFLVFYIVWKGLSNAFRLFRTRAKLDETLAGFIQSVLKIGILTVGAITALNEIGFNVTSILTSLGVLGLTLGFAAKDTLSNLISGIFIFWDRPFVLGDLIEIDGKYGKVTNITMRSTRIVTPDGKMLAIPNSVMANSAVASYTNFPHLRIDVELTIGPREQFDHVRKVFLDVIKDDPRFMNTPEPVMVVTAIGDYNVTTQFRVWIDDETQHISRRFELRERLFEAFRKSGIDMPYQTIQLAPVEFLHAPAQVS
ncbi:mechanosensitive ion channel family protein [Sulfurirhabdus autotrophica]|uniref:Small-conductance mechanosensitive channel n=1 Tax=Sulfurirhabdus autotrophica TaxID=1706046 RepID=A0A4R3YDZ4_9PROT|nr:mechanosensitive ion channel family protein [Sulfurirhabdus autotrophica]TCV90286.1 small conductance mechanosensitive channel [Sulfurirhabdus autotrophica]